jgi:hypothetical protein
MEGDPLVLLPDPLDATMGRRVAASAMVAGKPLACPAEPDRPTCDPEPRLPVVDERQILSNAGPSVAPVEMRDHVGLVHLRRTDAEQPAEVAVSACERCRGLGLQLGARPTRTALAGELQ